MRILRQLLSKTLDSIAKSDAFTPREATMNRRIFVAASAAVLAGGMSSSRAADLTKGDSVKVVVEGSLGTILRQEKTDLVSATVVAAGGEFFIDASGSKTVREDLVRLADQYIKSGSTTVVTPRLTVTGRLECRATKVIGEKGEATDGPKTWILVADSITVAESLLK